MQHFIGLKELCTEKPLDPSLLATLRKRLAAELTEKISEIMFLEGEDDRTLPRGRKSRELCKKRGVKLSGPKLGKPGKNRMEEIRQGLKEIGERNAIEGKFGNGKRKLGLGLMWINWKKRQRI